VQDVQNLLEKAIVPDLISHTSQMRKSFMASHLLSEKINESTARDANTKDVEVNSDYREEEKSRIDSAFPDDDENEEEEEEEGKSRSSATDSPDTEESGVEPYNVHSALNSLDSRCDEDQRSTAISFHDVDKERRDKDTKESPDRANKRANPEARLSLVQKRLQMFEARDKIDHAERMMNQGKTKSPVTQRNLEPDILRVNQEERLEKMLEEDSKIKSIDKRRDSFENISKQRKEEDSTITNIEKCKDTFSKDVARASSEEQCIIDNTQLEENSKVESIEREKENLTEVEQREGNEIEKSYENESNILTARDMDLSNHKDYPEDLNPFKSDEEDSITESKVRTAIDSKVSTNPFDSEDEDVEELEPPKPAARSKLENRGIVTETSVTKRILAAPQINLNPFWSDEGEEHDSDEKQSTKPQGNVPVPKPRTIKYVYLIFLTNITCSLFRRTTTSWIIFPLNRTISEANIVPRRTDLNRGGMYASNSSLTSSESTTTPSGTYRKKKPAPQPPAAKELFPSDQRESPMLKCNNTPPSYHVRFKLSYFLTRFIYFFIYNLYFNRKKVPKYFFILSQYRIPHHLARCRELGKPSRHLRRQCRPVHPVTYRSIIRQVSTNLP